MAQSVRDRVVQVMVDVFECSPEETATLRSGESPQWDSVGAASLVIALEDAFGVVLDGDAAASIVSLEKIVSVISGQLDKA